MEIAFPPQCRSRYRPEKLLASGGFGAVYRAVQVNLERPVAIKLLKSDVIADPEQVERFLAEARITASLAHQNVVTILDHAVEDGIPWIAYEFLAGRNVRAMLAAGPLLPRDAIGIAVQVAAALACAHDRKILHRDIKPENVLELEPGFYKFTDFGIAKWTRDGAVHTKTGVLLGTPAYMAPEQVRGEPPGPATDQYALGIMLPEMLTGAPPFRDAHPLQVLQRHVHDVPDAPSAHRAGLPPQVDAVCARALAKQPAQRFASCLAFKSALEELLPLFPPAGARAVGSSVRSGATRRPSQKVTATVVTQAPPRRAAPWAAGALAAALLAAAAVFLRAVPRPGPAPSPTLLAPASPSASSAPSAPASTMAGAPLPLPDALVCKGAEETAQVVAKMRRSFPLLKDPHGLDRVEVWRNLNCLQDNYIHAGCTADDDWFDAELQAAEPDHQGHLNYWVNAVTWRTQKYKHRDPGGGWQRVTHDALALLAALRQPPAKDGQPMPPPAQYDLIGAMNVQLVREHHWREPDEDGPLKLEWRFRGPLHALATYRGILRRGATPEHAEDYGRIEGVERQSVLLLKGVLRDHDSGPNAPPRVARARDAAATFVASTRFLRSSKDTSLQALRQLILVDVPQLADPSNLERLATDRLPPHPPTGAHSKPEPTTVGCTTRLEAASLSACLVDWLQVSYRHALANPAEGSAKELAGALLEAGCWRVALLAGTRHQPLCDEAITELDRIATQIGAHLSADDTARYRALLAYASRTR